MLTRPPPAPRTLTTGRAPRLAQVRPFGGLSPWPASSSKQMKAPGRVQRFYIGPHLVLPHRDRGIVAFHRLAHGNLAGPAMPAHQLPHPSGVYPTWNSLPISVLIRPRVHRWSPANPCASGPLPSSSSSRAHCRGLSFSRDTGPLDRSASVPPGPVPPPHRPR